MKTRTYWNTPYEPSKPSEPTFKDEVYQRMTIDIEQFGTYEECTIEKILSIKEEWLKENFNDTMKNVLFYCDVQNDGGNYSDDEYNLHVNVRYDLPLSAKEVLEVKKYNKEKREEYIQNMKVYMNQMSDYIEIKKEKEKKKEKEELEQYLKLKDKFDKR